MTPVNSQVVFITGGARGIGAEVARRLHGRGAKLVLTDLDEAPLAALATELGGEERVLTVVADVRDQPALQAAADQAVKRFGGIDVVLANAGILGFSSVLHGDPTAFKQVLDVNVLGVFHTVHATLPAVLKRRGYVLIVSSVAAFAAAPGMAAYDASKAGVEQLANALRLEVAHRGVGVGLAHMSWIDTAMVQDAKSELTKVSEMITTLPWPLNKTTSVDKCASVFVKAVERRKKLVFCPGWVRLLRWLKPVVPTRIGDSLVKSAVALLPGVDAEVATTGHSISARIDALEK